MFSKIPCNVMLFAKRQWKRQLKDTVYEIRGNAGGRLGDGETTEESGHILDEGRIKEGRATWPT